MHVGNVVFPQARIAMGIGRLGPKFVPTQRPPGRVPTKSEGEHRGNQKVPRGVHAMVVGGRVEHVEGRGDRPLRVHVYRPDE